LFWEVAVCTWCGHYKEPVLCCPFILTAVCGDQAQQQAGARPSARPSVQPGQSKASPFPQFLMQAQPQPQPQGQPPARSQGQQPLPPSNQVCLACSLLRQPCLHIRHMSSQRYVSRETCAAVCGTSSNLAWEYHVACSSFREKGNCCKHAA